VKRPRVGALSPLNSGIDVAILHAVIATAVWVSVHAILRKKLYSLCVDGDEALKNVK